MMIRHILFPLPFAAVWMFLTQQSGVVSFIIGYALSFAISLLITRNDERWQFITLNHPLRRATALATYVVILSRDIFMAGVDVSLRVMGIRPINRAGIIAVDVQDQSDLMAGLSGHSITITPGELVVEFDSERKVMYVHCLDVERSKPKAEEAQKARLDLFKGILDRD